MSLFNTDTIVALATAPLPAGVAIIRLSGPQARQAAQSICASFATKPARFLHYASLQSPNGTLLDHALLVWFNGPHSFTGEDVVEIHCHGGLAVVQGVITGLLQHPGVRMAEAGEFSRRAFLNQKMDLTEAEGLADLIAAQTEEQKKQALRQMNGELGQLFETWRHSILHLLAHVEAAIDFPDEELDVLAESGVANKITTLIETLEQALNTHAGDRLRQGFEVVIVGKPNAGKSTLTNLLTGKETAIVSPIAGTTRDVLETHLNIDGFPVVLADTAGLRTTRNSIEQEGVRRATARAKTADVVIAVVDAAEWPTLSPEIAESLQPDAGMIVISKTDKLKSKISTPSKVCINNHSHPVLAVNLTDKQALPAVINTLAVLVRQQFAHSQQAAMLNRERHRAAVRATLANLKQAEVLCTTPHTGASISELIAQDLRDAAQAIGTVTGRTGTEDVLDVVFSSFCIGK